MPKLPDRRHRLCVRVDADARIGMGHLVRCRTLIESLAGEPFAVTLATKRLPARYNWPAADDGIVHLVIPPDLDWTAEAGFLAGQAESFDAVILDISNRYAFQAPDDVGAFIQRVRECSKIVLFDGLGNDALLQKISVPVDILVTPYAGSTPAPFVGAVDGFIHLSGPAYYLFSPAYLECRGRKPTIRQDARRVLLTFGGTDPRGLTTKAIAALNGIDDRQLNVRVIIGPAFSRSTREQVEAEIRQSRHIFQVEIAPDSLAGAMQWADLAVASTGLTKYELALCGTPSIQMSIDTKHAEVNQAFAATGAARDLGVCDAVSPEMLRDGVLSVLDDRQSRQAMSRRGQRLVDGGGNRRFLAVLRRALHPARPALA